MILALPWASWHALTDSPAISQCNWSQTCPATVRIHVVESLHAETAGKHDIL
jgi:hypothetical protein